MSKRRLVHIFSVILFSILMLVVRLFSIVDDDFSKYTTGVSNTFTLSIYNTRASIYDRNLIPLVNTEKRYKVAVLPSVKSKLYLSEVLNKQEFSKIEQNFSLGKPFIFQTENYIKESDDIEVFLFSDRYLNEGLATHIIGYCDSDNNGVSGIEKAYNDLLIDNKTTLSLSYSSDASGKILSGTEPKINAQNLNSKAGICLSIDAQIQKITQEAASLMSGSGSVLITDVNTGEILSAVSLPTYNQNDIASSIASQDSALLNRNLCSYNIGSTYKIIVAAAALSKGYSPSFSHNCTGSLKIGSTTFNCHKETGHGYQNMKSAFSNSCNPFFISLGKAVNKERILSLSSALGLGKPIKLCNGIETAAGNIPSNQEIKTEGDLANISFGQGSLMATPVHIAKIISLIANGGYLVEPTLLVSEVDENGNIKKQSEKEKIRLISKSVADKIKEFMIETVENGTGKNAKPKSLGAGGKTASAETGWKKDGESIVQAWFSGFYPAENPKYAIVILNEGGNSGATACAPIFKNICDKLYEKGFVK